MFIWLGYLLYALGFFLRFVGGIALVGMLVYGVYFLFAKSVLIGLMIIGAFVVGGWVINIVSGLLTVAGGAIMDKVAISYTDAD